MALTEKLAAIGEAIRSKTGKTELLTLADMPNEIMGIKAGGAEGESTEFLKWVTFMADDNSLEYGKKPVAVGDDCADPIARGIFEKPTKESTAQYDYTHNGWARSALGAADSSALKAVVEDRAVYASYANVLRYYTVTYYDGETVLKTERLAYGAMPSYTPAKDGYDFDGWQPQLGAVTGEASYTANWKAKAGFATATWAEIANIIANDEVAQYFAIGDTREVPLNYSDGTTETVTFEIVDTDPSGIISGASIALLAQHTLKDARAFHSSNSTSLYYMFSSLLTYLNGTLTGCFPEDMQAVMKSVNMPFANGSSKVHVPTDNMLFGYSYDYSTSQPVADKDDMLSAFKNGKSKLCQSPEGTNADYWLACTSKPNASIKSLYPSYVSASGNLSNASATNTKYIRLLVFL